MIMSLVLFENEFLHIVSISFTALILNELIMVALEITTWYGRFLLNFQRFLLPFCVLRHIYMVVSEVVTLFFYVISIAFLPAYFGTNPFSRYPRKKTRLDHYLQTSLLSSPRLLPGKSLSLWPLALCLCTSSSLSRGR